MEPAKRKCLSVAEKLNIIDQVKLNKKPRKAIAKECGVGLSTIGKIVQEEEHLRKIVRENGNMEAKKFRSSSYEGINEALTKWYHEMQSANEPISGPLLMKQAKKFSIEMNVAGFEPNRGWLHRWKTANNVTFQKYQGSQSNQTMKPEKKVSAFQLLKNKIKKHKDYDFDKSTVLDSIPVAKKRKLDSSVAVNGGGDQSDETFKKHSPRPNLPSSSQEATECFTWLINPVTQERFFSDVWEKKPLLVKRHTTDYYKGLFSCKELDHILRKDSLQYGKDLDVTSYVDGKRQTHNADGRAHASVVWDSYQNGCSVRILSPQTYSQTVWKLNSVLQEYFGSFVGANVYLTPPGSQGFAPHYDDIEAFVLQIEGKKTWKLYSPRTENEELPRFSSPNFSQEEIGEPLLTVDVEPGDLLYFPRGIIHQATTCEGQHSLHITLSTYQKNTWGDLMEKLLPQALNLAIEEDIEFRRGLPCNYLDYMGVANCDMESSERDVFLLKLQNLASKVVKHLRVDAGVDQMAKQFVHSALPPLLSDKERHCSIYDNGERWKNGEVVGAVELDPDTPIKLIRHKSVRLVMEEDHIRVYHSVENSRSYQSVDPQYVEISADLAPAVEYLIHMYPEFIKIEEFPLPDLESKMEIANLLYEKGLLVTRRALMPLE